MEGIDMKKTALKKLFSKSLILGFSLALTLPSLSWGGPKGIQYVPLEQLSDPKNMEKAVEELTDDGKGKHFGKIKKVVIPSYFIEFRTVSSGRVVKKSMLGAHGVSTNATVTYGNPDPTVGQAIATAALADLTERMTAAGYEVVKPVDVTSLEAFKKLPPFVDGKITDPTFKQVGFSDYKSMYSAADGSVIYFDGISQNPESMSNPNSEGTAVSAQAWEMAGGEGVGVVRPKIVVEFVNFIGETRDEKKKEYNVFGKEVEVTTEYATISAIPQIKIYPSQYMVTRSFVKVIGKYFPDNLGSVYLNNKIELASTVPSGALGKIEDNGGKWVFTANNEKYKEAAIEQLKVFNALMVGKMKTFK